RHVWASFGLQADIGFVGGKHVFQVVEHVIAFTEATNAGSAHLGELPVCHSNDDAVIGTIGRLAHGPDAVFGHGLLLAHPGVAHVNLHVVFAQFPHNVHHPRIAQIGAVLLECKAHD